MNSEKVQIFYIDWTRNLFYNFDGIVIIILEDGER